MILVTGATGTIGREVLRQLIAARHDVRALVRDPRRGAELDAETKIVAGDLGRPETLAAALAGVDSVFLLTGGGPETPLHDANLGLAAAEAGTRHIVKLSIIGAEYGFDDLVSTWHLAGERALRQIGARPGGPAWTFVRPGEFMSNARLWAPTVKARDTVYWSQVEPRVAVIDPRDVAAVSVAALTAPGHDCQTYRIGGPEALSTRERVEKLAAALGRPIRLVETPIPVVRDAAAKAGRQPLVVETTLSNLTRDQFRRRAELVVPTVREVTGRAPYTFDEWLSENIGVFR
jgi:(4-alkanoyl-5-oxo-2,5-dihydrofuran-3-yl)methyl phosphate reductase